MVRATTCTQGVPVRGSAAPPCSCFCCLSIFEKNFCACDLICTAVLVFTCSARQRQEGDSQWASSRSQCGCQMDHVPPNSTLAVHAVTGPAPTFDLPPLPAMQSQSLHKQLMLLLGPPLPLFCHRVGLSRLRKGRGQGRCSVPAGWGVCRRSWPGQAGQREPRSHFFCALMFGGGHRWV